MDPSRLPGLIAVAAVARHGSFTRAAGAAGMSTSALSQTVRALEAQLGVRLFNRTTRRVALTEAGAQFLARVQPALAEIEAAFEALDETRGVPAGTSSITLSRVASALLVLPYLAEFMERCPQIRLELSLDDYVRAQLDDGQLVPVLEAWCPSFPGFYLYTAGRVQMPAKLRVLIDFLREKLVGRRRR